MVLFAVARPKSQRVWREAAQVISSDLVTALSTYKELSVYAKELPAAPRPELALLRHHEATP